VEVVGVGGEKTGARFFKKRNIQPHTRKGLGGAYGQMFEKELGTREKGATYKKWKLFLLRGLLLEGVGTGQGGNKGGEEKKVRRFAYRPK